MGAGLGLVCGVLGQSLIGWSGWEKGLGIAFGARLGSAFLSCAEFASIALLLGVLTGALSKAHRAVAATLVALLVARAAGHHCVGITVRVVAGTYPAADADADADADGLAEKLRLGNLDKQVFRMCSWLRRMPIRMSPIERSG